MSSLKFSLESITGLPCLPIGEAGRAEVRFTERQVEMAEIILYVDSNFGGLHTHMFQSTSDFTQVALGGKGSGINGNWNDQVSSFVIVSGVWQFFVDVQFGRQQGAPQGLGPGLYSFVEDFGIDNDALSSIQLVSG